MQSIGIHWNSGFLPLPDVFFFSLPQSHSIQRSRRVVVPRHVAAGVSRGGQAALGAAGGATQTPEGHEADLPADEPSLKPLKPDR